jgi:hypothetical protein
VSFTEHIDVTVRRALAMLEFVKKLSCEFSNPYTLKTLCVSLVLKDASCVWRPFYMAHTSIEFSSIRGQMRVDSSRDTGRKTC